jgi:hypothetical protein
MFQLILVSDTGTSVGRPTMDYLFCDLVSNIFFAKEWTLLTVKSSPVFIKMGASAFDQIPPQCNNPDYIHHGTWRA